MEHKNDIDSALSIWRIRNQVNLHKMVKAKMVFVRGLRNWIGHIHMNFEYCFHSTRLSIRLRQVRYAYNVFQNIFVLIIVTIWLMLKIKWILIIEECMYVIIYSNVCKRRIFVVKLNIDLALNLPIKSYEISLFIDRYYARFAKSH